MSGNLSLSAAVALCLVATVGAAPVITVGSNYLNPDTASQTIQLSVTGGNLVTGFNLRAQIGDGTGSGLEPVFQAVGFGGGIWDANDYTVMGGPVGGAAQFAQASVAFNTGVSVPAEGLFLTLTVDTTGFLTGSYPLLLKDTQIGANSEFILSGGGTLSPEIVNGWVIVPEPTTVSLLGLAFVGIVARRRRKA